MKSFETHHLLSIEEAKQYVMSKLQIFDDITYLKCTEIGDGNINYVFRVKDVRNNKSVIIKQADKCLRSSGRQLYLDRNRIEVNFLQIQSANIGKYLPKIYYYDSLMSIFMMEDIGQYQNLRSVLMEGKEVANLAKKLAAVLAAYLMGSSDIVLDSEKKKAMLKQFINPEMCKISEDLVFIEPYNNYQSRNNIQPTLLPFVKKHIYQNDNLINEVNQLRFRFMNYSQALIHGDLHTGSIFTNEMGGLKIIDPEFAFYGPMGYDIGNVIGHLIISLFYHSIIINQSGDFIKWLKQCINEMFDHIKQDFFELYERDVTLDLYKNEKYKQLFIGEIMQDALGYCGMEIIRRSIGDTKVAELDLIKDQVKLIEVEKAMLNIGIMLIMKRQEINTGVKLIEIIDSGLKEQK